MVDSYHIADESRQVYRNYYTVDNPAGAWILIKLPAWNANNEIVAIDGYGDNRQAHCVVHCGSRYQGLWGYQSEYNGIVVTKIRWKEVDSGKFAIVALIDGGITNLSIKSTSSLEISKTTADNAAFAISSSFFSSGGVFYGNVASATNADMLDGYHANGLLTALSNSNNGISITVGGTTKSISNISVNYAYESSKTNLLESHDERRNEYLPYEVPRGIRLRFQNSGNNGLNSGGYYGLLSWRSYGIGDDLSGGYPFQIAYLQSGDLCTRVGVGKESWSSWRTLAHLDSNVASATKLQTPRTIWGQSFDGTADVSGNMSDVG